MNLLLPVASALVGYRGPLVSPSNANVVGAKAGATAYAGVQFNSDGIEYKTPTNGDSAYNTSLGAWLDRGLNSAVWVQWTRTGGTEADWNSQDSGDGRNQLSTSAQWRILISGAGPNNTIIGYFEFWDAASDGNLLHTTDSRTFTAEWIV